MRAAQIDRYGDESAVTVRGVPMPRPAAGELRIRVVASSINPVDIKIRSGAERPDLPMPLTLGWDLAGHVVDTGPGPVTTLRPGDAVVAMSAMGATGRGTWADHVCLSADIAAAAPHTVALTDAAGLPLAGLAALDAVDTLDPAPGSTVLVTGATGAVGGLAVQLLRLREVTVHAAVRGQPGRLAAARALGADQVVTGAPQPGRYDGVLDTAGTPSPGALRRGGRYVSIVPGTLPELSEADGTAAMSYVEQDGRRLAHLVDLIDDGRLTLRTAATYPLDAVAEAMRAFDRSSTGKVILDLLQDE
ncbi:MAG: NADP-dependent oxidoreductase [Geodermatophilaceae bacterium]